MPKRLIEITVTFELDDELDVELLEEIESNEEAFLTRFEDLGQGLGMDLFDSRMHLEEA